MQLKIISKFIANYCKNINFNINYSSIYKQNDKNDNILFDLNGFDSVTLYNYSAINNLKNDDQNRIGNNNNDGNELFYRKISRDIFICPLVMNVCQL